MTRQTLQLSVRLLVLLLALALVFLVVSRPADAEAPVATVEYVVEAGDTLWEIAAGTSPGMDIRSAVLDIQTLNGIADGLIHPGQVLLIPTG